MTNTQTLAQCWTNRELDADLCSEAAVILLTAKNYVRFNMATLRLERAEVSQEEIDALTIVRQRIAEAISADPDGDHSAYNLENYEQMLRETINAEIGQRVFSSYRGRVNTTQAIELYFAREEAKAAQSAADLAFAERARVALESAKAAKNIEEARHYLGVCEAAELDALDAIDALVGVNHGEYSPEQLSAELMLSDTEHHANQARALFAPSPLDRPYPSAEEAIAPDSAPRGWDSTETPEEAITAPSAPTFAELLRLALDQRDAARLTVDRFALGTQAPSADLVDCPRIKSTDSALIRAYGNAQDAAQAADHLEAIYSAFPASHYQRLQTAREASASAAHCAYLIAVSSYVGDAIAQHNAAKVEGYKRDALIALKESIRIQREHNRQIANATNNAQVFINNLSA